MDNYNIDFNRIHSEICNFIENTNFDINSTLYGYLAFIYSKFKENYNPDKNNKIRMLFNEATKIGSDRLLDRLIENKI